MSGVCLLDRLRARERVLLGNPAYARLESVLQ